MLSAGGARLLTLPVSGASVLVTSAVVIKSAGVDAFAFVSLISSIALLLPFADLGLGAVVATTTADNLAGRVSVNYLHKIRTRSRLLLGVSATLLTTATLTLTCSDMLSSLLALPHSMDTQTGYAAMAIVLIAACIPLSLGQRILVGQGRIAELSLINLVQPLAALIITVALAAVDAPALSLACASPAGSLLFNVFCELRAKSLPAKPDAPNDSFQLHDTRYAALLLTAIPALLASIGSAFLFQSGRLVLAHSSTSEQLAIWSLSLQLFLPAYSVLYASGSTLWREFRRRSMSSRIWSEATLTLTVLGLLSGLALVFIGPVVLKFVSSQTRPSAVSGVLWILALVLVAQAVSTVQAMYLTDTRGFQVQAGTALVAAGVGISLGISFAGPFGAEGVALALLISTALLQLPVLILAARWRIAQLESRIRKQSLPDRFDAQDQNRS